NAGNNLALETCGESSSSHGTGGPKPGPSKKTLNERKRKYGVSVNKTVQNIEWNVDHFLKVQHERRQELYKDYSHQFLTLVMMWNIDVDQIKKQAGKLSGSRKQAGSKGWCSIITSIPANLVTPGRKKLNHHEMTS
ncbi:mCG114266, partial [Mus musculus]